MVKVIKLTDSERALREKESKLVRATEEFLKSEGKLIIVRNELIEGVFGLKPHSNSIKSLSIRINSDLNTVFVSDSAYYHEAHELARIYELLSKQEFTIKTEY